jgi:hypothetical protein
MGKQTVEDAKKRWSAGFAASEVNPSPNRLGVSCCSNMFLPNFF